MRESQTLIQDTQKRLVKAATDLEEIVVRATLITAPSMIPLTGISETCPKECGSGEE